MNIVSLLHTLLASVFEAEQKFFENPKDFYSLESSVKSSTEAFAAEFLGAILSEMDQSIRKSAWREGRYKVHRNDTRTLISSVGDISFECTYYKGMGDGGGWIKSGTSYIDKSIFCADKYHLMQYINAAAAQMLDEKDEVKNELWHMLYSKKANARGSFDKYTTEMMRSAKNPERVEVLRKYALGNWAAVRRTLNNKLVNGCSAESHVSHVLSDRLSSRPMGWSQTGADRMSKLRCYDRNNGRAAIVDLVKYSRKQRLAATGTEDIAPGHLKLREVIAEHYNQANSYIERLQVNLPYGTAKKILTIRESLYMI